LGASVDTNSRLALVLFLILSSQQQTGVTVEDTGIRFAHKAGKEHDKFVFIPDKSSQSWFFEKVAGVVKAFNIRRRMDA
jgi:vacuolar protein sorting-associated protein 13A/C